MELLYPDLVNIELTNHCSLRCNICPLGRGLVTPPKGFMDEVRFEKIINEVSSFPIKPSVGLYILGDSLLHKKLFDFIRIAKSRGLYLYISLNGYSLTSQRAEKLAHSEIDELLFSFEGANAEYYTSIRGNNYERVKNNILFFLEILKKQRIQKKIRILSIQLDLDKELILPEKLKEIFSKYNVEFHIYHVADWRGELPGEFRKKTAKHALPMKAVCTKFTTALIKHDGRFIYCSLDFNSATSPGNIDEMSILEFYNSQDRKELLSMQKRGLWKLIPLCQKCSAPYTLPARKRLLGGNKKNEVRETKELWQNMRLTEHKQRQKCENKV